MKVIFLFAFWASFWAINHCLKQAHGSVVGSLLFMSLSLSLFDTCSATSPFEKY